MKRMFWRRDGLLSGCASVLLTALSTVGCIYNQYPEGDGDERLVTVSGSGGQSSLVGVGGDLVGAGGELAGTGGALAGIGGALTGSGGGLTGTGGELSGTDENGSGVPVPPAEQTLTIPALDACDDQSHAGETWQTHATEHFNLYYLPGTAAGEDILRIAELRERAYTEIQSALRIESQPVFDVYLSPNRAAALEHGKRFGASLPGLNRYEAIYTGGAESFEVVQYGYHVAQLLLGEILPEGELPLPVLATGVAEYLDQSVRDRHLNYAERLLVNFEPRTRVAEFTPNDVYGMNFGFSGSLVSFFVEEHGLTKLGDLLQATAVSWQGCYFRPELGCIDSEDALGELMSSAFQNVAGETWNDFRERWRAQIQALLDDHLPEVDAASLEELTELIKVMDYAISSDDAEAYRAIMDGFYCDEENEAERMDAANRIVTRIDRTTTTILSAHPIGRKNYMQAWVSGSRIEGDGNVTEFAALAEKFDLGWRISWTSDFY